MVVVLWLMCQEMGLRLQKAAPKGVRRLCKPQELLLLRPKLFFVVGSSPVQQTP
jgi:hypothetical protein